MALTERFQSIASAAEPGKALASYLGELFVRSDEDRAILDKLMTRFRGLSVAASNATASFAYGEEADELAGVVFYAPSGSESPVASLAEIAKTHFAVTVECRGGGALGFPGGNSVEDYLSNEDEFPSMPQLVFDVGQNIMIAHPEDHNSAGEPVLYFIDHEDGEAGLLEGADALTGAQVFLRLLVQNIFETAADEKPYFEAVCF